MTIITTKADLFAAAMHFVSHEAVRFYLNGVLLDPEGYIVALDGHRMFVGRDEGLVGQINERMIIRLRDIKNPPAKWAKADAMTLDTDTNTVAIGTDRKLFDVIDGAFPDWRRVIPSDTLSDVDQERPLPTQYGPAQIAAIAKASKLLTGSDYFELGYHNQGRGVTVRFPKRDDCFAVVMPYCDSGEPVCLPSWAPVI